VTLATPLTTEATKLALAGILSACDLVPLTALIAVTLDPLIVNPKVPPPSCPWELLDSDSNVDRSILKLRMIDSIARQNNTRWRLSKSHLQIITLPTGTAGVQIGP
jgi:hypothetical protein